MSKERIAGTKRKNIYDFLKWLEHDKHIFLMDDDHHLSNGELARLGKEFFGDEEIEHS